MADEKAIIQTPTGVVIQGKESGAMPPETPKVETPSRPAWLPEKFKSPEDLAKSYTELEKKLGTQGAPKKAEEPVVEASKESAPSALQIEANKAVAKAGLDMKALQAEFIAKGDLTPESKKALADAGIGEDQIKVYQRGMEAERQDYEAKILEGVDGGRELFNEALQWAKDNLSPEEKASFNKAVELGDPNIGKLAVQGLLSQYQKADGPRLINGQRITGDQGDVFRSQAQITAAQSDRRYATDPAYRDEIQAKILRSDFSKFSH